jgi:hypothetical protein
MTWLAPWRLRSRADVVEDQQRWMRKPPPTPNMPGQETHRRAHGQQHEDVDGNFRDRDRCPPVSLDQFACRLSAVVAILPKGKLLLQPTA